LKYPNDVALREKSRGLWKRFTWKEYYEKVQFFSLGLVSLGLEKGDKVSLLGESKPQVFWSELAAMAVGAVAVGVFTDCIPSEVKFYLEHSDSKFVVAQDQEQVDKVLQIEDQLPLLKKVIYWDPIGLWFYDNPILIHFDQVLELGREFEINNPGLFEKMVDEGNGEDIAVIVYTSGTTSIPKGAMLNQKGMVKYGEVLASVSKLGKGDEWLAFMPIAWIGGQGMDLSAPLCLAMVVNFPEKPETVQEDLREIGPSGLAFGPRQWEAVNRMIQARISEASPMNRFFYNLLLPVGYKVADLSLDGRKPNVLWRLLYLISNILMFYPLRDRIGLTRTRIAFTGGTAISPEIIRFFFAIGIKIKQLYGSSEMGLLTAQQDELIRPETCGTSMPGAEIRLSEQGEILVKAEWRLVDYYKDHKALEETIRDGWYHTGDFGYIDASGHLIVMDRMKDLRSLADGKKFSPQYGEVRLRFSPYIKEVLVVGGEDRAFVGALINIDLENAGNWAEARHISYTTYADLSQKNQVVDLIRREIAKVNLTLPDHARIKRFINMPKEFDPDEAELTRSRKLRRTFLEERYGDMIEALYGNEEEILLETQVTYRDGRTGTIKNPIRINEIHG